MKIVEKVTMNEKGQITIPFEMRQRAGIQPNDELLVVDTYGLIRLVKPEKAKI